jgi:hypothetical protein
MCIFQSTVVKVILMQTVTACLFGFAAALMLIHIGKSNEAEREMCEIVDESQKFRALFCSQHFFIDGPNNNAFW